MIRRILVAIISGLFCLTFSAVGQETYMIGRALVAIDPEADMFSLPLQGYGDPAEGRFTLEWMDAGSVTEAKSLTGDGEWLYLMEPNGDLYRTDIGGKRVIWEKVGATNPVALLAGSVPESFKVIAGGGGKLYAVSLNNKLSVYDTSDLPMKWDVVCPETPDAVAMASAEGRLYITDASGVLWRSDPSSGYRWERMGKVRSVPVCMAAAGNMLYLLTDNQRIWQADASGNDIKWREIAYINGVTYRKPLKHIAVASGRLYGVGLDDSLYVSQHKSDGTLSVRCITVSTGKSTAAIIAADIGAIEYPFTQEVKREIEERYGLPPDAVLLNVSHTHFSPVTKVWRSFGESGLPDERYLSMLQSRIVECVGAALADAHEASLWFARTESHIGFCRSLTGPNALYDPNVDVVKVKPTDGSCGNIIFMTGCHPVFPNAGHDRYTISANYIGMARKTVEELTATENSIFLQACGGDTNPRLSDFRTLGTILGFDVAEAADSKMVPVKGRISFACDSVQIPVTPMSREEAERFRAENADRTSDIEAEKNVRWADMIIHHYDNGTMPQTMDIFIQTLNVGNWKIVGLSREPVAEYGVRIRNIWPKGLVSVLGYCNDVSSYLPNAVHIRTGTYEGHDSFLWYGEPSFFSEDIVERVMNKIKKEKR